jgi:branched-chain amino acid transport system permease protein
VNLTLYWLQQLLNGLSIGSQYALMAVGLAMVFGILRLINFAHGDLMMVAAYIAAFSLLAGLPVWTALLLMILGTVLTGILMERTAYRPIRGAPAVAALLTSFAVGQLLQNGTLLVTRLAQKPVQMAFPMPDVLRGVVFIGDLTISRINLISLIAGPILLALLVLFIRRTVLGTAMRATAEDLQAAQLMGIDTNRVIVVAFVIGSVLASIAGFLYASQAGQINPYIGFTPVLKAFIAMIGGYTLGFLEVLLTALPGYGDLLPKATTPPEVIQFLQTYLPSELSRYRDAFVFVALILLLLLRPGGILNTVDREERV